MQYLQVIDGAEVQTIVIEPNDWQVMNEFLGIGGMMLEELLYDMVDVYVASIRNGRGAASVIPLPQVQGDA